MAYKVLQRNRYRENMISVICPTCKSVFAYTPDEIKTYINSSISPVPFNAVICPCCNNYVV